MKKNKMKFQLYILLVALCICGCATSSVRFKNDNNCSECRKTVYPATRMNADMISFVFTAFTADDSKGDSVHLKSFGCVLGPPLLIIGIVDLPISIVSDTIMLPCDLKDLKKVKNTAGKANSADPKGRAAD